MTGLSFGPSAVAGFESLAEDPTEFNFPGRLYWNTTSNTLRIYDGTSYVSVGSKAVADVAALKAIGADGRKDNDIFFVASLDDFFKYDSSSSATADDSYVIQPDDISDGDGRWLSLIKGYIASLIKDEDDMASDSSSHVPTQQSVKAYVDNWLPTLAADVEVTSSPDSFTISASDKTVHRFYNAIPITVKLDDSFSDGQHLVIINGGGGSSGSGSLITVVANSDVEIGKIGVGRVGIFIRKENSGGDEEDSWGVLISEDPLNMSSGGAGNGINFIENGDFENTDDGWDVYDDGSSATPVDGTGGTAATNIFQSGSSPLVGTGSLSVQKFTGDYQGEGFSCDFTVDSAYRNRINYISFEIDASISGTQYVDGDLSVFIYDVDNSALITPTVSEIKNAKYKFTSRFMATDSVNYRLIFHITTSSNDSWSVKIDNVRVGPDERIESAPIGSWISWTPTGAWSTNTTYTGKYRRVGSDMELRAVVTLSGAPDNATFTLNLPANHSMDTSVLSASSEYTTLGNAVLFDSGTGANRQMGEVVYSTTTALIIRPFGSFNQSVNQTAPFTWASGDVIELSAKIPIAEWAGSTTSLTNTRVEYASVGGTWDADGSTTVYGPAGTALGGSLTARRTKTITWLTPVQPTDIVIVQGSSDRVNWTDINASVLDGKYVCQGTNASGSTISGVSFGPGSTEYQTNVYFHLNLSTANDDDPVNNWPSSNAYWRAVKCSNPLSVGSELTNDIEPTQMTDAQATRLGLKVYSHGTTYAGGNAPTVTLEGGGGSLSSVGLGAFIPYQVQDGSWRMKFNIKVTVSSDSRASLDLGINGVTIPEQAVTGGPTSSDVALHRAYALGNSNIRMSHATTTTTTYSCSGDVALSAKPTWAY